MSVLETLFAFVVLLSVLIFVHELGHFAVAKWCGVRVLKFSLGFGNPLGFGKYRLRWKRGHTEYVVASIPLGGFVKMLGENPDDEDSSEARANPEEALNNKPLPQKLAIVFAGPVMNLILPVLIFAGMLAVGLPRADAIVGLVETGSPAEQAGLAPGDRISAVDGEPVRWWSDVARVLRSSPGEPVELAFDRGGEIASTTVEVGAREGFDDFGELAEVGWAGIGHSRPKAVVAILDVAAPASEIGLRSGDRVTAIDDVAVDDWYGLAAAYEAAGTLASNWTLERGAQESKRLTLSVPALGSLEALGVVRANALIESVSEDSPAARAGLAPGDLIVAYDGERIAWFAAFARAVASSEGEDRQLAFARNGELREITIAAEPISVDNGFGVEETRYRIGIRGQEALVVGSVGFDQERNPLVSIPRAVGMTVDFTRIFLEGLGKLVTGEVSRKNLAGPIGIAQIAGNAFQQGWEPYLRIMILISINLGILNLLPIPVLDGGQAVLFTIEGIKRSPLSLRTKLAVQQVGITVLFLLMGLAFWNDLSRIWIQVADWLPSSL